MRFFKDLALFWRVARVRAVDTITTNPDDLAILHRAKVIQAREVCAADVEDRPPPPDQIALTILAALLSKGGFATEDAAIATAWYAVPHYYLWRERYAAGTIGAFLVKPVEPDPTQFDGGVAESVEIPPIHLDSEPEIYRVPGYV